MKTLSRLRGPDSVDTFFRSFVQRTAEEMGAGFGRRITADGQAGGGEAILLRFLGRLREDPK